jgi:hypothetical protein
VTGVSFSGNGAGLTNIPINYGSGTQNLYTVSVSNLLSFPVCGRTVNLIVTGSGLNPSVSGVYTQRADHLGNWAWHSTNSFYIYYIPDSFPIWTISSNLWNNYSEWAGDHYMFYKQPADLGSPAGAYMAVNDSVGAPVVSYSITYNPATASKMTLGSVSPTSSVVELRYNNAVNDTLVRFGDSNVFFRPVIIKDSLQASSLQITGSPYLEARPTDPTVVNATSETKPFPFSTLVYRANGSWDGSTWIPGVVGKMNVSAGVQLIGASGSGYMDVALYRNKVIWRRGTYYTSSQPTPSSFLETTVYNDIATNEYYIGIYNGFPTIMTNRNLQQVGWLIYEMVP